MIFYKIEAVIADQDFISRFNSERRHEGLIRRSISMKTTEFNNKYKKGSIFVSHICDENLTAALVAESGSNIKKPVEAFTKCLGLEMEGDIICSEITITDFRDLAENASRNSFLHNECEIMEKYCLDRLERGFRDIDFGENIFDIAGRRTIKAAAEKNLVSETLFPEMERIYAGRKIKSVKGHPVHYIVRTDDHDIRNETYQSIMSMLFENKRLDCRRYAYIDFRPGCMGVSRMSYEALYRCSRGGSVVVRFYGNDGSDDDGYASCEQEMLELIAEMIKTYRNDVLTIVCFQRECTRALEELLGYLGNVSMVEIEEELADGEKAMDYLKLLAKGKHIPADDRLMDTLEADRKYLSGELKEIFEAWYDEKIRKDVYPQYKDFGSARCVAAKQKPKGSGYDELMEMVGLDKAKSVISKALNFYKLQKIYSDKGICMERPAMHMVFTGNPGTAKTTAARLFARIMKENGLLSKGNLIEVGRSDLVAKYVGWTAKTIKDKFEKALGSVLFIDEAYSLVDDRNGSFGDEAINTIVQEMENHRNELVVIFAGYPDKMEEFLNKNPGLRSRIAFHVPFDDYNTEELGMIAEHMCGHLGTRLTDDAKDKLSVIFDSARENSSFGNGRYVRNVLEMARMNQAGRILGMDPDSVTDADLRTITAEDIEAPEMGSAPKQARSIGFCA